MPVTEDESKKPESPYGESKLTFERVLASYARAYDLRSVSLRYFNAAGRPAGRHPRRGPRARDAPDPAGAAGGGRPGPEHQGVRHGLPDP